MKRSTFSIGAISFASTGLLLAAACSTDDSTSEDGTGGTVGSGGNTYLQGGNTARGGSTSTGGATAKGGTGTGAATGNGGTSNGGSAAVGGNATGNVAGKSGTTAGSAGRGGSGGAAGLGLAGSGVTAGKAGSAGAGNAGNAGNANSAGTTSVGGTNSAGSAGKAAAGMTNTAGAAGATTAGNCPTAATSLAKYCTPQSTVAIPNTATSATRDTASDPRIGTLQYHVYNGVVQLYGAVAASGVFWQGTPYTDANCTGAGVDATGKTGMTLTVQNLLSTPVTVLLVVQDQAGTTAPYPLVTMTATAVVNGSATTAVNVPFSSFVPSCTLPSGVSLNYATIRQIGFGFGAAGNVDVALSNITFY